MSDVGGSVERGYETLREAFAAGQATDDGGAQLCVYRNGKKSRRTTAIRPKLDQRLTW